MSPEFDTRPRCLGATYDRHDPRPMEQVTDMDIYECPACESRVEIPRGIQ